MSTEMGSPAGRAWLPQHDAALKALVLANLSYRDAVAIINEDHGTKFTRSAAIGRGNRLGLCNPMPAVERKARQTQRTDKVRATRLQQQGQRPVRQPDFKPEPLPEAAPFDGRLNLPLRELFDLRGDRSNQCRAIDADDISDALYCGTATRPGRSWCDHHHARFCQKAEPRLVAAEANRRGRKVSNRIGSYEEA